MSLLLLPDSSSHLLDRRENTRFNSVPFVMCVGLYRILSITVRPLIPVQQDFYGFCWGCGYSSHTHCV